MSKLSEIYKAHIAEMKSILKISELLLLKEKNSLSGDLAVSGKICEDFIKSLISAHLPGHLRITSGYILDLEKKVSDENLPQFDLLLVDNRIPPIYRFKNLDIEVVPVESVCGVFELKRYIDKKNIKSFVEKLSTSVLSYANLSKNAPYNSNIANPSNMSFGINHPLIGIISLTSGFVEGDLSLEDKNIIDIIWSLDGFIVLPVKQKNNEQASLSDILARPKNDSYAHITKEDWRQYINDGNEYMFYYEAFIDRKNPELGLARGVGWLTYIFYRLCGRQGMDFSSLINGYYFQNS